MITCYSFATHRLLRRSRRAPIGTTLARWIAPSTSDCPRRRARCSMDLWSTSRRRRYRFPVRLPKRLQSRSCIRRRPFGRLPAFDSCGFQRHLDPATCASLREFCTILSPPNRTMDHRQNVIYLYMALRPRLLLPTAPYIPTTYGAHVAYRITHLAHPPVGREWRRQIH